MEKILQVVRTRTFYNTGVIGVGTFINGILGFVFYFLLARFFNPELLGVFIIVVTTASLLTDISAVGTDTGIINFVGRHIDQDKNKGYRFLKLALEIKIIVFGILLLVGWLIMPVVAQTLFQKADLTEPLRLSLVVTGSLLVFGFVTSALQALQKFYQWSYINIFSNAFRLIGTILIFLTGILTLNNGIFVYLLVPLVASFVGFLFLPNFFKVKKETSELREFFNYNKWVAVFTLVAALASRLDTFLVARFADLNSVGIYSVAATLTSIIPQFVGVIGTVVAPKLTRMENKRDTIIYLKKLQLFVCGIAVLIITVGLLIGYIFIRRFYAEEYWPSFLPYAILVISQCIFLISIPVHMAATYYFSYPKIFVLTGIINLLVVLVCGSVFINLFGYVGVAFAILIGNSINFLIPGLWVWNKFKA